MSAIWQHASVTQLNVLVFHFQRFTLLSCHLLGDMQRRPIQHMYISNILLPVDTMLLIKEHAWQGKIGDRSILHLLSAQAPHILPENKQSSVNLLIIWQLCRKTIHSGGSAIKSSYMLKLIITKMPAPEERYINQAVQLCGEDIAIAHQMVFAAATFMYHGWPFSLRRFIIQGQHTQYTQLDALMHASQPTAAETTASTQLHLPTPTPRRPVCEHCKRAFSRMDALYRHQIHTCPYMSLQ